jgi:hypothetical protein
MTVRNRKVMKALACTVLATASVFSNTNAGFKFVQQSAEIDPYVEGACQKVKGYVVRTGWDYFFHPFHEVYAKNVTFYNGNGGSVSISDENGENLTFYDYNPNGEYAGKKIVGTPDMRLSIVNLTARNERAAKVWEEDRRAEQAELAKEYNDLKLVPVMSIPKFGNCTGVDFASRSTGAKVMHADYNPGGLGEIVALLPERVSHLKAQDYSELRERATQKALDADKWAAYARKCALEPVELNCGAELVDTQRFDNGIGIMRTMVAPNECSLFQPEPLDK